MQRVLRLQYIRDSEFFSDTITNWILLFLYRAAFNTLLKMSKLLLTVVGYAQVTVVAEAIQPSDPSCSPPPISASAHNAAVILQQALQYIPNPATECMLRNMAVRLAGHLSNLVSSTETLNVTHKWKTQLRIPPTFTDALRKKIRTCASFKKTLPNYISVESLINVVFDKKCNFSDFFFCEAPEAGTNWNDWGLFDWIYRVSNAAKGMK